MIFCARAALVVTLVALILAGCASTPPGPSPAEVQARITAKIPANVNDRSGWAMDVQVALTTQGHLPNVENICAVLAVLEQEGGYVADPAVPNLGNIARSELERRANAKGIPDLALNAALRIRSSNGQPYGDWLASVRTERELSALYEELIGRVPLGPRLLEGFNPVQTGGPMQVSIGFAERNADGYPYPVPTTIRHEVFTRRGGLYFGILHLLGYETPYTRKIHRFADYNAGHYASRNAAFQNAVAVASGRALALDGDVLAYGAPLSRPGETERALRSLGSALGMDDTAIRSAMQHANTLAFNRHPLFERVFALAEQRAGHSLPREMLPGIRLESPKITRELTTAWFAERVNGRYQSCLQR